MTFAQENIGAILNGILQSLQLIRELRAQWLQVQM